MQSKTSSRRRAFWPVIGFVLAVSLGIIAYALGPAAYDFLRRSPIIPNFPPPGVPRGQWELILSGILFIVMVLLVALVIALAVPRDRSRVNEKKLVKEREMMIREKKAKKILQRQINREARSINPKRR